MARNRPNFIYLSVAAYAFFLYPSSRSIKLHWRILSASSSIIQTCSVPSNILKVGGRFTMIGKYVSESIAQRKKVKMPELSNKRKMNK